ncbi:DUF6779 domain-containing protein [Rhodococcus sp. HNM0569]|uniref:DUF6779 domain-containing protein n=1 Tax=Rhodococcus sp. HNM0569 TaxID=2716340 RepID=UPI00146E830D|nr:DUF6779 domain-containing protein [Rhodococcus sp. HNM0569]NLU82089.1 hypothetical protein [Rhodococcus sp. HNM0569]
MTNPGRGKTARRFSRRSGQLIVAGMLALAVVASLFLVFSDSVVVLRVGVVVAAWAALLGAIALDKYQREAALDRAKTEDLQKVYELQLEREVTARREYELTVEKRVREEVGADAQEMAALRAELAALRKNLEVLFDGPLPAERVALRADSTRIQELVGRGGHSGGYNPVQGGTARGGHDARVRNGAVTARSAGFASPDDAPVTAETTIVPADYASAGYAPPRGNEPVRPRSAEPEDRASDDTEPEEVETVDETETFEESAEASGEEAVADQEGPVDLDAAATAAEPTTDAPAREGGRRRRRDEDDDGPSGAHANGLTVAEILARASSEQRSGGRRRRAD